MNRNKLTVLMIILAAFLPLALTGCGGGSSSAAPIIFEAEYGSVSVPYGMSLPDLSGVSLQLYPAGTSGATCPSFLGVSGTTSTSTGQYSYVPPCDPLDSIVSRAPSAHCPFYNPAGGNVNWVYEAYQYYSGSTVYNLPCGVASPNLVISPVSFVQGNYVTLSMTASPGDFDPSGGTPLATYYDQYGSVLGQLSVSSTSSDEVYRRIPLRPNHQRLLLDWKFLCGGSQCFGRFLDSGRRWRRNDHGPEQRNRRRRRRWRRRLYGCM